MLASWLGRRERRASVCVVLRGLNTGARAESPIDMSISELELSLSPEEVVLSSMETADDDSDLEDGVSGAAPVPIPVLVLLLFTEVVPLVLGRLEAEDRTQVLDPLLVLMLALSVSAMSVSSLRRDEVETGPSVVTS